MITDQQSKAITWIRTIAMFSIVICHYLQAYGSSLASVFNVGVPIFFCISGYLYGNKNISNWKKWFGARVLKVYVPYLIFVIFSIPFYLLFSPQSLSGLNVVVHVFNLQGFAHIIRGGILKV